VGQRYRDTVLALGGGVAPQQVWQLFRGRPHADPSALLRHQGLIP
jgi:oligopeptidase A